MQEVTSIQNSQMSSADVIRIKIEAVEALFNALENRYPEAASPYEMYLTAKTWLNAMKSMIPND